MCTHSPCPALPAFLLPHDRAGKNVLGLLGAQLAHASIGPSLLVVHGVDSHVQLTTVRNRTLGKVSATSLNHLLIL